MTQDPRASPLDPIPLTARVVTGRAAATIMGGIVLVAGVLALAARPQELPLPPWLAVVLVGAVVGTCTVIAVAPWQERLSRGGQEVLLSLLTAIPATGLVLAYALDEPTETATISFLAVIVVASAITVPLVRHLTGTLLTVAAIAASAMSRGALSAIAFELLLTLAVAGLAGIAAAVLARTVATSNLRESEAAEASRALLAVVDAARSATTSQAQDVLDAVVNATQHLASDTAGAYLLGSDGMLRYGATHNIPDHLLDEAFPPDHGIAGRALRADETIVTNEYGREQGAMEEYRDIGLRAAIAAPIRVDGSPVGVLVAGRYREGGYRTAAVTAFELLADHAGRALALSYAIDEDRRLLERLRSLHALQEDFVATVSHELRTPLTVIDGLAETLERRHGALAPDQAEQLLSRLRANTTTLATIVTSLLEAARLDRGLVEVEETVIDLWDLLESCVARLEPILDEHVVRLDLEDALVLADGDLLERVIDNLITNAQRHTPAGTTVHLRTQCDGDHCTVVISDDGPGIAPADLATITERFRRGGDLHTRSTRGLGLGLALADQVLRLHGSRLRVTSPPGEGARFEFRLRLAREAARV